MRNIANKYDRKIEEELGDFTPTTLALPVIFFCFNSFTKTETATFTGTFLSKYITRFFLCTGNTKDMKIYERKKKIFSSLFTAINE